LGHGILKVQGNYAVMVARKRKNELPIEALLKVGGVLLVLFVLGSALSNAGGSGLILLLIIGGGVGAIIFLPGHLARQAVTRKISESINAHMAVLVRKRAQTLQPDAYGAIQTDRWFKEIDYFLDGRIKPGLGKRERTVLNARRAEWQRMIEQLVSVAQGSNPAFAEFSEKMSPAEFEVFCAEELRRSGWNAYVTKAARDQGVDVVADKNGVRLVIQCKLYSQAVGNKAVQEIVAARAFERAQYGAVVTNNRYTASAQELAFNNDILLLHYSDLRKIDSLLNSKSR
jgi:restriction system protein